MKPSSVSEGFTTRVMNPLNCDDGAFITISEPLQLHND
jgi:hypothetical protein